jgi:hypothetical protein
MANRIQLRRDTAANWTRVDPILSDGEPGLEVDTGKFKFGDGNSTWQQLTYVVNAAELINGSNVVVLEDNGTLSIPGELVSTAVGTPTFSSNTSINLTAANRVNITSSPLRLAGYSSVGNITAVDGDIIYNTTTYKFQGYAQGAWIDLNTVINNNTSNVVIGPILSLNVDGGGAYEIYETALQAADGGRSSTRFGLSDVTYDGSMANITFTNADQILNGGGA